MPVAPRADGAHSQVVLPFAFSRALCVLSFQEKEEGEKKQKGGKKHVMTGPISTAQFFFLLFFLPSPCKTANSPFSLLSSDLVDCHLFFLISSFLLRSSSLGARHTSAGGLTTQPMALIGQIRLHGEMLSSVYLATCKKDDPNKPKVTEKME